MLASNGDAEACVHGNTNNDLSSDEPAGWSTEPAAVGPFVNEQSKCAAEKRPLNSSAQGPSRRRRPPPTPRGAEQRVASGISLAFPGRRRSVPRRLPPPLPPGPMLRGEPSLPLGKRLQQRFSSQPSRPPPLPPLEARSFRWRGWGREEIARLASDAARAFDNH